MGVVVAPMLAFADTSNGVVVLVYALVVAAVALVLLIELLRVTLPRMPFSAPSPRPGTGDEPAIAQLETIRDALAAASSTSMLPDALRPIVHEIVAARVRRHHRIDLDLAPDRAHSIVGDGCAWSLARPDYDPANPGTDVWLANDLDNLLDELEAL
jgi:hypothetical protein